MAGVWSRANRPRRPGAYINWVGIVPPSIPPVVGSVVCVPFTHDWGPFKTPVLCNSWDEFLGVYGGDPNNPSAAYIAVNGAFKGEGLYDEGRVGAGAVLAYRMGGASAAKASRVLQNTTPAAAVTLTAKYEGARGNNLRVTVQDYAADSTQTEVIVYEGTAELERYRFADTDVAGFVAQVTAVSNWVTPTLTVSGVALAPVTSVALTGGDSGLTLVAGDYTATLTALGDSRWGVFAPYNLTDTSIKASLLAWAQDANRNGKRFFTVFGGPLDEPVATANLASQSYNDPDVVNFSVGHTIDDEMLDANGNSLVLSPAQLAPRIAGIIAAAGEARSISSARLAGLRLVGGASAAQIETAFDAGTLLLSRDNHPTAPVKIEKGINTFTTKTDPTRPQTTWSRIRNVAIMHGIDTEFTDWFEQRFVGAAGGLVDQVGREAALTYVTGRLAAREAQRIIQAGSTADIDRSVPSSPEDEFIALALTLGFGRSAEQVLITTRVG